MIMIMIMISFSFRFIFESNSQKRKISVRNRKQRNIQHENSMSTINEEPLKRPTTDVAASGNGTNICAIL